MDAPSNLQCKDGQSETPVHESMKAMIGSTLHRYLCVYTTAAVEPQAVQLYGIREGMVCTLSCRATSTITP